MFTGLNHQILFAKLSLQTQELQNSFVHSITKAHSIVPIAWDDIVLQSFFGMAPLANG